MLSLTALFAHPPWVSRVSELTRANPDDQRTLSAFEALVYQLESSYDIRDYLDYPDIEESRWPEYRTHMLVEGQAHAVCQELPHGNRFHLLSNPVGRADKLLGDLWMAGDQPIIPGRIDQPSIQGIALKPVAIRSAAKLVDNPLFVELTSRVIPDPAEEPPAYASFFIYTQSWEWIVEFFRKGKLNNTNASPAGSYKAMRTFPKQ